VGSVCWVPDPELTPIPEGVYVDSVVVLDDESGNGLVNPGEGVKLAVFLRNTGDTTVYHISLGVNEHPAEIQDLEAVHGDDANGGYSLGGYWHVHCPEIAPGQVVDALHLQFYLDSDVPIGPLVFSVALEDEELNEWTDQFEVEVVP